jgi:hypothetical protein
MDDLLPKLVQELAVHSIRVHSDGSVVILDPNDSSVKQPPLAIAQAISKLRANASDNAQYALKVWANIAEACHATGAFPSNDITRRMFISAVKHLLKQSQQSVALKENGTFHALVSASRQDITVFSEEVQNKVIESRLVIDWVSHLVAYDQYRVELLEVYFAMRSHQQTKLAFGPFQRDLDIPEEKAIPWSLWKDHLLKTRGEQTPSNEEKDPRERDMELRTELGMDDTSEHGFLDEYDEIAHGKNFKKRMRNTMGSFWAHNQKDKDFGSVEFGARAWGDKNNLGPHEQGLK